MTVEKTQQKLQAFLRFRIPTSIENLLWARTCNYSFSEGRSTILANSEEIYLFFQSRRTGKLEKISISWIEDPFDITEEEEFLLGDYFTERLREYLERAYGN